MDRRTLKLIQDAAQRGRLEGILFGFDIFAIALNHRYGFGDKRLSELDEELQEFCDLIQKQDWDKTMADIVNELTRIRKGSREKWLERYIK